MKENKFYPRMLNKMKENKFYPRKLNTIKDKFNGIQVTNFHNWSTWPLNYRIYARPQAIKTTRLL